MFISAGNASNSDQLNTRYDNAQFYEVEELQWSHQCEGQANAKR